MEIWATYYGAEAGVMGLRCIPTGGLFLAGGMTHKLIHLVEVMPRVRACERPNKTLTLRPFLLLEAEEINGPLVWVC